MKTKRLLSGLITVAMLLSLCVTTAFAAGTDYKAGLTVAKVDDAKLSVSLDVGPTGTETKIQGVQSCVVAFDLSVLKPLNKAGNKELTGITTEYSKEKSLSFEDFTDDDDNTWATKVYVYKSTDGATCYYLIQPANGAGSTLTNMVSLAKVYLGFQTGKSYDDVKADTVRFATAAELAGKASDKALKFNDGSGSNYAWSNGGTGDTLTFAAGNEPKVEAKGFTFAGTSTTYTVSFDANGGTGTMADVTGVSGEYTLPANGFTAPSGKQFKAWSVGGSEKAVGDKITVTANTTVTAVWEDIPVVTYTVSFDANGGSVTPASAVTGADGKLTSLPTPTRSGSYSFAGWYTAASGGTQITTAYVFSANTTVYAHWTYTGGGGGGGGSYTPSYTVSVDKTENGTITVSPKSASKGDAVTITVKPDKGYELDTLKVLDKNGDKVKLTEKNGKYTFTMPTGKVTVKGSFVEEAPVQIFKDVPVDAYYYEAVKWAAEKGITGGVGNGLFAPNQPCTRAQIVTFLWRAAGSPTPKHMSSFADVPADAFYAKAVAWAVENGITGGTGEGKFSPNATCTRAQSVTFLYRAAGSPKVSSSAEFGDVATNAYYADAVAWAAKNGITGGIGGGLFGSDNDCTRAQIVTFLYRSVK